MNERHVSHNLCKQFPLRLLPLKSILNFFGVAKDYVMCVLNEFSLYLQCSIPKKNPYNILVTSIKMSGKCFVLCTVKGSILLCFSVTGHDDLETLIKRSINKINTQQHGNEGNFYNGFLKVSC